MVSVGISFVGSGWPRAVRVVEVAWSDVGTAAVVQHGCEGLLSLVHMSKVTRSLYSVRTRYIVRALSSNGQPTVPR